jgi:hypothetical protein
MLWDNRAVLERRLWLLWGWSLGGFRVMLQSSLFDSVAFDPFAFQQDGLASVEVDIGRCQVLQAFVIAAVSDRRSARSEIQDRRAGNSSQAEYGS